MQEYFEVLSVSRGDVYSRLLDRTTNEKAQKFTNNISDHDMSRLAGKMGDIILDNGDYWLAIDYWLDENYK